MGAGKSSKLSSAFVGKNETDVRRVGIGIASNAGAARPQIGARHRRTTGYQVELFTRIVAGLAADAASAQQQGIRRQYAIVLLQSILLARVGPAQHLLDFQ